MRGLVCLLSLTTLTFGGCSTTQPVAGDGALIADAGADRTRQPDRRIPDASSADAGAENATWLRYAERAGNWLAQVAERDGAKARWPQYVGVPAWTGVIARPVNLYAGAAGTALFLHRLAQATGRSTHSDLARAALDHIVAQAVATPDGHYWKHEVELPDGKLITYDHESYYEGAIGVATVLMAVGQARQIPAYVELAKSAAKWVMARATRTVDGCSWVYDTTDIIGGNAGTILALLELHQATQDAQYLKDARCAGDWLLAIARKQGGGFAWSSTKDWDRIYPGFSHGVAGIAFALGALYERTQHAPYLEAARQGGLWLKQQATCDEQGCRWSHYAPGGTTTFYTGWAHGIAGTARALLQLARLTKDTSFATVAEDAARWSMTTEDPSKPNTVFYGMSLCCGAASTVDFFVDLYRYSQRPSYLAHARAVAQRLVEQGQDEGEGTRWTNYALPDSTGRVWYGTGLRLGAPGVGWALLRLASVASPTADAPTLPDERL